MAKAIWICCVIKLLITSSNVHINGEHNGVARTVIRGLLLLFASVGIVHNCVSWQPALDTELPTDDWGTWSGFHRYLRQGWFLLTLDRLLINYFVGYQKNLQKLETALHQWCQLLPPPVFPLSVTISALLLSSPSSSASDTVEALPMEFAELQSPWHLWL